MEGATEDPDPGRKEPVKSEKKAPKKKESGRGKGRKRGKLQLAPKVPCTARPAPIEAIAETFVNVSRG